MAIEGLFIKELLLAGLLLRVREARLDTQLV
jgi:hypothetical protein